METKTCGHILPGEWTDGECLLASDHGGNHEHTAISL